VRLLPKSQAMGKVDCMKNVPDTELFSAYLDGELTAEEQGCVEQVLAASAEARQLLEELRALGSTLQSLPQERLDEDFSSRVLEVAARQRSWSGYAGNKPAAGRAADSAKPPEANAIGLHGSAGRKPSWRRMFGKRSVIWSGVAVAAVVLLSFATYRPRNRDFARLEGVGERDGRILDKTSSALTAEHERVEPPLSASTQPRPPAEGARHFAINPPPPTVIPKAPASKALEVRDPENATLGLKRGVSEGIASAKASEPKGDASAPLMNGPRFGATNGEPPVAAADNPKGGKVQVDSFSHPPAPAATIVHLDVSAPAVRDGVFEKLLAQNRLGPPGNSAIVAESTPVDSSKLRFGQMGRGGPGGSPGAPRKPNLATGKDSGGVDAVQLAPAKSASGANVGQPQEAVSPAASLTEKKNATRALKTDGIAEAPAPDGGSQFGAWEDPSAKFKSQVQQSPARLIYEFDASPEQLAIFVNQIRERSDSFSMRSLSQSLTYGADNYGGGIGSGGTWAARPGTQQSKADAVQSGFGREEDSRRRAGVVPGPDSGNKTASLATGRAKQHLVFVLNVVDRLAPAAGRTPQTPAPAAATPAKH
jgi:hypothetical protein